MFRSILVIFRWYSIGNVNLSAFIALFTVLLKTWIQHSISLSSFYAILCEIIIIIIIVITRSGCKIVKWGKGRWDNGKGKKNIKKRAYILWCVCIKYSYPSDFFFFFLGAGARIGLWPPFFFRGFCNNDCFTGWGCKPHAQPQLFWKTNVFCRGCFP
jgi:hypothetical protein